jgi:dTDP-4-dehydrorhamnose 3,5-epimerase
MKMIEGIIIKNIKKNYDERGFFAEILREDWKELLYEEKIVQFNLSYSYPGVIRAWHRHLKGQIDNFVCINGSLKICAYDDSPNSPTYRELDEIILNSENPKIVRIPGLLWHGYKVIGNKPATLLYGVNKLYNYHEPDEERRPWNDPNIIPLSINGKKKDPRVGNKWDWNYPPYK